MLPGAAGTARPEPGHLDGAEDAAGETGLDVHVGRLPLAGRGTVTDDDGDDHRLAVGAGRRPGLVAGDTSRGRGRAGRGRGGRPGGGGRWGGGGAAGGDRLLLRLGGLPGHPGHGDDGQDDRDQHADADPGEQGPAWPLTDGGVRVRGTHQQRLDAAPLRRPCVQRGLPGGCAVHGTSRPVADPDRAGMVLRNYGSGRIGAAEPMLLGLEQGKRRQGGAQCFLSKPNGRQT
jgi:hypothetical protein